jgi:transposase
LLLHALVHSADIQDRDGGVLVMATLFGLHPFLLKLYADGGYQGPIFQSAVRKILRQIDVEIVKRSDIAKGFAVLPKRWIVERTIAWLNRCRRWPRIGSASTERPWRSCARPQSASCCESSVKKHHDPGQTLRGDSRSAAERRYSRDGLQGRGLAERRAKAFA